MTHRKFHERALFWLDMKDAAYKKRLHAVLESSRKYDVFGLKFHYQQKAKQYSALCDYCQHRYNIVINQIKAL